LEQRQRQVGDNRPAVIEKPSDDFTSLTDLGEGQRPTAVPSAINWI
jgi:hypothetical protein